MKHLKFFYFSVFNIFLFITYPAVHSVSTSLSSSSDLKNIIGSDFLFIFLVDSLLLFYLTVIRKKYYKFHKYFGRFFGAIISVIYLATAIFVCSANPFQLLSLSFKLENPKAQIDFVCEEELDDDTFLEIVKENDTYKCFIVRKKFLSYCHDVTGHNYFWHNNEVNSKTLPYVLNIPKLKENETESLIFYSVLDSDINMAYVDGNEMQIITDGNIRLAYYISENETLYSSIHILTKVNNSGETIFETKL